MHTSPLTTIISTTILLLIEAEAQMTTISDLQARISFSRSEAAELSARLAGEQPTAMSRAVMVGLLAFHLRRIALAEQRIERALSD